MAAAISDPRLAGPAFPRRTSAVEDPGRAKTTISIPRAAATTRGSVAVAKHPKAMAAASRRTPFADHGKTVTAAPRPIGAVSAAADFFGAMVAVAHLAMAIPRRTTAAMSVPRRQIAAKNRIALPTIIAAVALLLVAMAVPGHAVAASVTLGSFAGATPPRLGATMLPSASAPHLLLRQTATRSSPPRRFSPRASNEPDYTGTPPSLSTATLIWLWVPETVRKFVNGVMEFGKNLFLEGGRKMSFQWLVELVASYVVLYFLFSSRRRERQSDPEVEWWRFEIQVFCKTVSKIASLKPNDKCDLFEKGMAAAFCLICYKLAADAKKVLMFVWIFGFIAESICLLLKMKPNGNNEQPKALP